MPRRADLIWFAKALATAAAVLALCAFASKSDPTLPLPTTTTVAGNFEAALDRYALDPDAQVVLTGSSLTVRLREDFFAQAGLRNLAIGGGSMLTGLEIVASYPRLPPLILVEANVISRGANPEVVRKYSNNSATSRPLLAHPVRLFAAHYQSWMMRPRDPDQERARIAALLREPPTDYVNADVVERQLQSDNSSDFLHESRDHAAELSVVVASLQQRGSRVYFYRLPLQGDLEHSRYAQAAREVMHETFPEPERWINLDMPLQQLRWADGLHLDERSAALLAQSLDRAIAGVVQHGAP
jgi:hypothetical protein